MITDHCVECQDNLDENTMYCEYTHGCICWGCISNPYNPDRQHWKSVYLITENGICKKFDAETQTYLPTDEK